MLYNIFLIATLLMLPLAGCSSSDSPVQSKTDNPQRQAIITELRFAETPEEIATETAAALVAAKEQLDAILTAEPRTFENTIVAIDTLLALGERIAFKYNFLRSVSPDENIREAASTAYLGFAQWYLDFLGDSNLHAAVEELQSTLPLLSGEDLKLMQSVIEELKSGGFGFDEMIQRELAETSINAEYIKMVIQSNIVGGSPRSDNIPLLEELVRLRAKSARLLGHASWSDLRTEHLMAGSGATAMTFLRDLADGLGSSFADLTQDLLILKSRETESEAKSLSVVEASQYQKMYLAEQFGIEEPTKERVFSYQQSLDILFKIAHEVFGIEILSELPPGKTWHEDVSYHIAQESSTGLALGSFYLDPYRREGKDDWPRIKPIAPGLTHEDGSRNLPVLAFVLDFPTPTEGSTLALNYSELRTLFHEFGHLLHYISGKSNYNRTGPRSMYPDFTEIFSQLLEQWLIDPTVLEAIAATETATSSPFSTAYLADIVAANQTFAPINKRFQIAQAMTDLRLHSDYREDDLIDAVQVFNDALTEFYFPHPGNIDWVAPLSHMTYLSYDSRYYGYEWSRVIAVDFAGAFKDTSRGLWDAETGMKLRRELFDLTSQRTPEESITAFLGRKWNTAAYLEQLPRD